MVSFARYLTHCVSSRLILTLLSLDVALSRRTLLCVMPSFLVHKI